MWLIMFPTSYYRKSSIHTLGGGLFNFEPSSRGGGLIKRGLFREGEMGDYSQNQVARIYLVAFHFFYPIFCRINIQFCGLINWKTFGKLSDFVWVGGKLIRWGLI